LSLVTIEAPPTLIKKPKSNKRMLEIVTDRDGLHVYINSSSLSVLQSCPRKAYYILHRELRSKYEAPALTFGTAIHKALEVFYAEPREGRIFPTTAIAMRKDFELLAFGGDIELTAQSNVFYRSAEAFLKAAAPLVDVDPADKRSMSNGLWTLGHYFENYQHDPYTIVCDAEGPMVERSLQSKIHSEDGLHIYVHGQIDVVLKNEAQGQICAADHKTSSQMGKDFYNRLKPNHQYSGYVWLAQQELGIDSDLFIVNGVEVKAKPKTARGSGPKFPRQITRRTVEDLKDFKDAIVYWTHQYLEWKEKDLWPIGSVDSCAMWGGCGFLKVCSQPENIRPNIIEAEYE